MADMRKETDSLGVVEVPADKLWGASAADPLRAAAGHFSPYDVRADRPRTFV